MYGMKALRKMLHGAAKRSLAIFAAVLSAAVWAEEAASEAPMGEVYHARDFRKSCEYLLEQAVNGKKEVWLRVDEKEFGHDNREMLFFLLPYYRLAEANVQVVMNPGDTEPVLFLLTPKYKSCVKMLNYARGHRDTELTEKEKKALKLAEQALREAGVKEGMSEAQKARALHDWVVKNCAYDLPNAKINRKYGADEYSPFDGKYLFLEHRGVCDSYVQAYWLLLQMAGVPCSAISGYVPEYREGHAWNLVHMDDHWAHVDTTFDDPVPDVKDQVVHVNFDKTAAVMRESRRWAHNMFLDTDQKGFLSAKPVVVKSVADFKTWLAKRNLKDDEPLIVEIEELRSKDMAASMQKARQAAQEIGKAVSVAHDILYPYAFRIRTTKRNDK